MRKITFSLIVLIIALSSFYFAENSLARDKKDSRHKHHKITICHYHAKKNHFQEKKIHHNHKGHKSNKHYDHEFDIIPAPEDGCDDLILPTPTITPITGPIPTCAAPVSVSCEDWSECKSDGTQSRTCTTDNVCSGTITTTKEDRLCLPI
jgi:hypothetical protein